MDTERPPRTVVCFDFDDTLCDRHDAPIPGARAFVESVRDRGVRVVVHSARFASMYGELVPRRVAVVEDWLADHGFPVDAVVPALPRAIARIDDRAVPYAPGSEALAGAISHVGPAPLPRVVVPIDAWFDPLTGAPRGDLDRWRAEVDDLAGTGTEVAVATGPALGGPLGADAEEVHRTLRTLGWRGVRCDIAKIGANVVLDPSGIRFDGDWSAVDPALESALVRANAIDRPL